MTQGACAAPGGGGAWTPTAHWTPPTVSKLAAPSTPLLRESSRSRKFADDTERRQHQKGWPLLMFFALRSLISVTLPRSIPSGPAAPAVPMSARAFRSRVHQDFIIRRQRALQIYITRGGEASGDAGSCGDHGPDASGTRAAVRRA